MPIGVIYLDTGCTESLAVLTLEDEQIVWMDKSSQTDKSSDVVWICPSVHKIMFKQFLETICLSRRTSQPKTNLNLHWDRLRQTKINGRFARRRGMDPAKGAMVCEKFAWK